VKFLCEHCKAKYQIADEKVAGRTVRMKCRKCGNSIEVRAAVTETSVNAKLLSDRPEGRPTGTPEALPKLPKPPTRPLATSLSGAQKPPPARPTSAPRSADQGTLAGAFQRNVQKEDEISVALDLRELSAADEWYVAINGVPVGPVRVAELRRKAAIGVVTEDSLCWQEGMEEWRPVRAVPDLAAVVREAAASGRVSLVTPPPPEAYPASSGPSPRPGSMRPSLGGSTAARLAKPSAMPTAAGRNNVVAINSRLATAERLHDEPKLDIPAVSPMIAADPFASPSAASAFRPPGPPFAPLTHSPAAVAGAVAATLAEPPTFVPGESQKKPPPLILIAMFVLAGAFGVTAAILVFKPAPQVVVQVPTAALSPVAAPTASTPVAASSETVSAPASPGVDGGQTKVASGPRPASGSTGGGAKATSNAATDPALRDLINGAGQGPNTGPGESSGSGGGAQLNEDQVKSVLAMHTAGVKRTCWERVQSQSSSVNVTVHIVVGSSGQVSSATATGNDPVVGHCIEGEVRRWTFPGSGTIDIPFHFLRQ
jgi:predicted Zn finger-like uncharacterized protein